MKAILTLVTVTALLTACGSGDGGGSGLLGSPDSTSEDASPANDNPLDVQPPGEGGFDTDLDVVVDDEGTLSDEIVTAELLLARQVIVGTWDLIDPATQCVSSATFDGGGQFVAASLDEITSGFYEVYLESADISTLSLVVVTDTDNQLPDCDGDNSSDVGGGFDLYLSFPSVNVLRLSGEPGGSGNTIDFTRRN